MDLLDFGDSNPTPPAPSVPPATSFSAIESVQSDPYYGGGGGHPPGATTTNHAHQSFTSLPAMTTGYGLPPSSTDFATAAAPGALVVAAPSTGYGGYGVPPPPTTNPYVNANPYALVPAPNPSSTAPNPYGPTVQQSYPTAAAPYGNPQPAGSNPYGTSIATSSNPYAAANTNAAVTNPYAAPVSSDQPPPSTNPYGVAATPSNPYLAPIPASSSNPYGAPVAATNPYGTGNTTEVTDHKSAWTPPSPITTQPNPYDSTIPTHPYETFNGGMVPPPAVTPHAQQTPSSLGFGSPAPDFSGFTPAPDEKTIGGAGVTQVTTPFGNLTMNGGLASVDNDAVAAPTTTTTTPQDPTSSQQQQQSTFQSTFAKLANLDNFSVSSKSDAQRMNPFESSANATIGGGRSLGDMAKNKVSVVDMSCISFYFL